ncbi:MAG: helix-turn-helix domain-containing protein [Pseudomonadota bacterium]|uniref:GlxA family transcriptional regulator n=1 Tax=Ralstonia pickettii TaxID=329 RepID=UPI002714D087|nr:helix-turn-helix domain-containing protein [Ralstonia pickettii]MEE2977470.1 helix-turn-helix domain-containing protein [Pseudomonadota bacterium]WKZ84538.1 helix-turn-helix domain-containing protein [Ralstonia pickettii]
MPKIDLLTFPDAAFSTLATAADTLGVANALASMQAGKRANAAKTPVFGWRLVARDPARWQAAAETLACRCEALPQDDAQLGDALIVPPLHFDHIGTLEQRLALLEAERATVRRYLDAGRLVASPFTGVAMLADVLPPGQRLTVTWLIAGWVQGNFPSLKVVPAQAIVSSGNVITARAMEHGVALMHRVVARLADARLARTLGNTALDHPSRGEAIGIWLRSKPAIRDSVVLRARRYLQQHLHEPFHLGKLAAAASTSERTLLRHFTKTVGMSPLQLLHRLRVERACHLLEVSTLSLTTIAEQCGYQDMSAFRRLIRRHTGRPPGAHRRAHSVRAELRN